MPLSAQIDALGIEQITGKIDGVLSVLADVHPKVTVNGQQVSLSIEGATGLAPLLDLVKQLPADPKALEGAVTSMLGELEKLVALPDLSFAAEVAGNLDLIRSTLDTVAQQFGGDPAAIVDQLIGQTGGLEGLLHDIAGRITSLIPKAIPDEIRTPFDAIRLLAGGTPTDAAHLADILARFVLGIDLATLRAPSLTIDASVDILAAADVDLHAAGTRFGDLAAQIRAVVAQVQTASPDVPAILATLVQIRGAIDALFAELPAKIQKLAAQLDRIDTAALAAKLMAAADAVAALMPNVKLGIVDEIVDPLRGFGQYVATLTPEAIAAVFDDLAARIKAAIESSDIGVVPKVIEDFEDLAIARLREVGLSRFRDEIVAALAGVEARIRQFPFSAPQLLAKPLGAVREKLDQLDTKPITDAIKHVEDKINEIIHNFDIGDLKDKVAAQFDAVKGFVDDAVKQIEGIDAELQKIADQVNGLDFEGAADQARALMEGIRKQVEDLLSQSDLGAAARSALSVAAEPLGQIDFHAEVSAPIDAQLDKIDPAQLLAPLKAIIDKLRAALDSITPSSLVKKLDQPFNDALAELERYKPSALLAAATGELTKLVGTIDALDPRKLVIPLQKDFDALVDRIRAAVNPDPLFKPIEDAWGSINGFLDKVDPVKILTHVVEKVSGMPQGISTSVTTAAGAAETAVDHAPALPFKFGDVVRPFALLVQQVRAEVGKVPDAVLDGALTAVVAPLSLVRALLDGEKGLVARFVAELQQRMALLIPGAGEGPASDLADALRELEVTIEASAHLSAEAHVQLGGAAASMTLDTRLTLLVDVRAQLDDAAARLFAGIAPPDLERALRRALDAIDQLVPPAIIALPSAAPVKQRLDAFFASFDPTPVAAELDAISAAIEAKMKELAHEIIKGIVRVLDSIFGIVEDVLPVGMLERLEAFMKIVRDELLGLDPKPIKDEVHRLIDSVLGVLEGFSPAAIAASLGVLFDDIKAKITSVTDLFGPNAIDTTALDAPFEQLKQLQPSVVLKPLADSGDALEKALDKLLDIKIGEALANAVVRLRAAIEAALDDLLAEFEELLAFLKGGGEANVSVTASF
jgi:hypothetical protein